MPPRRRRRRSSRCLGGQTWTRSRTKKKSSPSSPPPAGFDRAFEIALGCLRARDRFVAEIRASLAEDHDPAEIDAVINRLSEQRLVDDRRLVRQLMEANRGKKAVSVEEFRRRLVERGADPTTLSLLDEAEPPELEPLLARFERSERGRARAYRFLAARGFGEDEILEALNRHLAV